MVTLSKISQASYLTAENATRYLTIMHFFYQKKLQLDSLQYRTDILEMMRTEYNPNYSDQDVDQDLRALVAWGNLIQRQEIMLRPKTIEEYKNKYFRYQITERGVVIEEMLEKLAHIQETSRGSLDKYRFLQLVNALEKLPQLLNDEEIYDGWDNIRRIFSDVQNNTSDYIAYITSEEVSSRMQTESFLIYKDKFINYLRDFIIELQKLYYKIQNMIQILKNDSTTQNNIINALYHREKKIPRFADDQITIKQKEKQFLGELKALSAWFIDTPTRVSEYQMLMTQTNQIIAKLTSLIYFFGQELKQYQSRRQDYLKIADWFMTSENLQKAHEIYAAIFGMTKTRHFHAPSPSEAAGIKDDIWQLSPSELELNKRGRMGNQTRKTSVFSLDKAKQWKNLQNYLAAEQAQNKKIRAMVKNDKIDFSEIDDLDSNIRKIFLKWISLSIANCQGIVNTEFGYQVKIIIDQTIRITVKSIDGTLEMPHVLIHFIFNEKVEDA